MAGLGVGELLATRKQIEPRASGVQTIRSACFVERASQRGEGRDVEEDGADELDAVAHQSIRRVSSLTSAAPAARAEASPALMHSTYCRYAALVKKIEPTK